MVFFHTKYKYIKTCKKDKQIHHIIQNNENSQGVVVPTIHPFAQIPSSSTPPPPPLHHPIIDTRRQTDSESYIY